MILLLRWLINAGALLLLSSLIPGLGVSNLYAALIAALFLGLVNAIIRPVLQMLALPLTILTLGLFALVVNALCFWFVASFVDGFAVSGFVPAFLGALAMSIVSYLTNEFLRVR